VIFQLKNRTVASGKELASHYRIAKYQSRGFSFSTPEGALSRISKSLYIPYKVVLRHGHEHVHTTVMKASFHIHWPTLGKMIDMNIAVYPTLPECNESRFPCGNSQNISIGPQDHRFQPHCWNHPLCKALAVAFYYKLINTLSPSSTDGCDFYSDAMRAQVPDIASLPNVLLES
jgi:hypothetical protein